MKQLDGLTDTEKRAVRRYLKELQRRFPEIARTATFHRARDDIIYIRADLPRSDKEQMRVRKEMSPIATEITVKYRVALALMPKLPWEQSNLQSVGRTTKTQRGNKMRQTLTSKNRIRTEVG